MKLAIRRAREPELDIAAVPAPATAGMPDLPMLLGLRSGLVVLALGILAVGYAAAAFFATGTADVTNWIPQILALAMALAAITTCLLIPTDPLPLWAASILSGAALVALAIGWWTQADNGYWWVQVSVPPTMTAVFAGLLALRGRAGLGWVVLIGAMGIAAVWAIAHGESVGLTFSMTNRILGTVLPATVVAVMLRPMMTLLDALRARELEAVEQAAAVEAANAERAGLLAGLQRDVRPVLERIAAGETFTVDEARRIQILENALRDDVRGRGWSSEGVRQAVSSARLRGVAVQLFDDGGLDLEQFSARDAERLRGEVIRVLASTGSGVVTARILPPGRDRVATIICSVGTGGAETGGDQRICRWTPGGLEWSRSGEEMHDAAPAKRGHGVSW